MAGDPDSCSECEQPAEKRGMCNRHYLRWWKATPKELRRPPTDSERFWSKVQKGTGCWEWQACRRIAGYGMFRVNGRTVPASRFALEEALGYPPPPGTEVCHRCDNPPCVNPRHLYYGTRQNNVDDAWARGLVPIGSQRSAAKVTEADVEQIRLRYAAGTATAQLAGEYGIAVTTLRQIVLGLKWKHAPGPITRRRSLQTRKAA